MLFRSQMIEFVYQDYVKTKISDADNATENHIDKKLLEEYIDRLTEQLPPRRKDVFILSRKEGLSNKEIAEKLKISESTIETQLSKAITYMKQALKEHYEIVLVIILISLIC